MRRYLLDTSPLTAYLMGRPVAVERFRPWIAAHALATSAVVYAEVIELLKGRSDFAYRRAALRRLLREVFPYSLTYASLERYADIRRQLRPPYGKGLIGDIDILIAATALERDLTVVTCDTDYERVPDLTSLVIPRDEFRR